MVAAIASHLSARPHVVTREPGGTPEGEQLRALLLSGAADRWDPLAELLLMTAARVQHVRQVIRPALARGEVVVTDRFVGSTIAYQGGGDGVSEAFIRALHRDAADDLWPDLTIVLDVDPAIGLARSHRRLAALGADEGRFERLDLAFHRRVRASFLEQAARDPDRHAVVDASQAQAEVREAVVACLGRRF